MRSRSACRSARERRRARPFSPSSSSTGDGLGVGGQVATQPVGQLGARPPVRALTTMVSRPGRATNPLASSTRSPSTGQRLRLRGLVPGRRLLEEGDRLARRDQRPGELLGELEEGPDRADHEQAVAEEADQLTDGEVAGEHLAGAGPHQDDQEAARQEHADGLDARPARSRPRRRPAGCAGTAARSCGRRSAPRRCRAGSAARPRCRSPSRSARSCGSARRPAGGAAGAASGWRRRRAPARRRGPGCPAAARCSARSPRRSR